MLHQARLPFEGYTAYITLINSNLAQRFMPSNIVLSKFRRTVVFNSTYFTQRICSIFTGHRMKLNVFLKQIQIVIERIAFDTTETKIWRSRNVYCPFLNKIQSVKIYQYFRCGKWFLRTWSYRVVLRLKIIFGEQNEQTIRKSEHGCKDLMCSLSAELSMKTVLHTQHG